MRPGCHYKSAVFNLILLTGIFRCSCDNGLRWLPRGLGNNKSSLVQVMAWCCHATSHYLSPSWCRSMSPYGGCTATAPTGSVPSIFMPAGPTGTMPTSSTGTVPVSPSNGPTGTVPPIFMPVAPQAPCQPATQGQPPQALCQPAPEGRSPQAACPPAAQQQPPKTACSLT